MKKDFKGLFKLGGIGVMMLLFLCVSCGTRNVHKTEISETVKKDSVSKTKETAVSESQLNTNLNVSEDNFTIEPIESNKPIEITDSNGKVTVYKNARIKRNTKTDKSIIVKSQKKAKIKEAEVQTATVRKNRTIEKQIERENGFNWWLLLIPVSVMVAIAWLNKKYKDQIWFI